MSSVTIKNVRFSYVYVFEPSKMSGKYSVRVLVPKDNTEALNALKEAIEECKRNPKSLDTWKNGGKVPGNLTAFLRDGDVEFPDDPVYKNNYFFNSSNTSAPTVLDTRGKEITSPSEFYSGCFGAFNGSVFAYNSNGNRGISVSLDNLLKQSDGEKLTGGQSAKTAFAGLFEEDDGPFKDMM